MYIFTKAAIGDNFERDHPSHVWSSDFQGEDLNVKV
jgi:hypothetical protein